MSKNDILSEFHVLIRTFTPLMPETISISQQHKFEIPCINILLITTNHDILSTGNLPKFKFHISSTFLSHLLELDRLGIFLSTKSYGYQLRILVSNPNSDLYPFRMKTSKMHYELKDNFAAFSYDLSNIIVSYNSFNTSLHWDLHTLY
jgi:hypothetical protein